MLSRYLTLTIVGLVVLLAAGPALVALAHALLPVVIAAGVMAVVLRVTWYFTTRW